jgi:uncharacterized protein (TIGR02687 family)
MNKIKEALLKSFDKSRIIFWYDAKEELHEEFQALEEEGFKKIHVEGNEFEVKYSITKQHPKTKFLLYFTTAKPDNEDNWLLDIALAHHVFHTDQEAMFLQEIGLEYHLKELVTEHIHFFKSKDRRLKLKYLLGEGDEHEDLRMKILAVTFNVDYVNLIDFIQAHCADFISGREELDKNLEKYNLYKYYWAKIKNQFNYEDENPTIYDFLLEVFNNNFSLGVNSNLTNETYVLLSRWKNSIQNRDSFAEISDRIADDINLKSKLNNTTIDVIIEDDLFKLTELKIIHELSHLLSSENISFEKAQQYIKKREQKFWYSEYQFFYKSLKKASEIIYLINKFSVANYTNFNEGIDEYATNLYRIDALYRHFIWSYRQAGQNKILAELAEKIEKMYSNDWLLTYNNNWQKVIDNLQKWPTTESRSQQQFFNIHVKPIIAKKQRLFVIISDALRYECGAELNKKLQATNRYESTIDPMVASLPSYTQLGMASLLPHKELTFKDKSDAIVVDGKSSSGILPRSKILAASSGVRATAINAEDFMKMNSQVAKGTNGFVQQYDLIYIYHNRIDKAGDDTASKEKVFEAAHDEINFLMEVMKKIANMNGNNIMVTSDHGFIYQHNELDESEFSESGHKGEVWKVNRRFVIGKGLTNDNVTKAFKATDLNIASNADVLIPKSINRLKVKASEPRFVHGGASMQEIVIPLIKVTKKRKNTTTIVEIDVIQSSDRITTNILPISFIQTNLTSEQILPRTIRAGIYFEENIPDSQNKKLVLLSDLFTYNFDVSEGSERQREVKHRFSLMSKASAKYKNKRVKLILEEPVDGSSKWKKYNEFQYSLNISFTNDFDDI